MGSWVAVKEEQWPPERATRSVVALKAGEGRFDNTSYLGAGFSASLLRRYV